MHCHSIRRAIYIYLYPLWFSRLSPAITEAWRSPCEEDEAANYPKNVT